MAIDVIGRRFAAGVGLAGMIFAAVSLAAVTPAEARHRHHGRVIAVYPYSYGYAYPYRSYAAHGYYSPYARPSGPRWDYAY